MKFSNGIWDGLFGEKMTIQVRQDNGSLRDVTVTKAWWQKMQADGNMTIKDIAQNSVHLHIVGPDGLEQSSITIGEGISEEAYKRLVDPETQALYAIKVYQAGKPEMSIVPRKLWEQTKRAMDAV